MGAVMIGNCDNCDRTNVPVSNGQFCGCDTTQCYVCQGDVLDPYGELEDLAEIQIERRCDFIIRELDEFCGMASNPETVDLIENQRIAVGQMLTRVQLIAAFLMSRQPRLKKVRNHA